MRRSSRASGAAAKADEECSWSDTVRQLYLYNWTARFARGFFIFVLSWPSNCFNNAWTEPVRSAAGRAAPPPEPPWPEPQALPRRPASVPRQRHGRGCKVTGRRAMGQPSEPDVNSGGSSIIHRLLNYLWISSNLVKITSFREYKIMNDAIIYIYIYI